MAEQPFYIVFAGVNGTGKSTFFHSGSWHLDGLPITMSRINPDEIAVELASTPEATPAGPYTAGKIAVERIEALFENRESFNQETTLSGRSSLRNIRRAHALGYRIFLFYLGVESESIALERIAHRASIGGHDIDEKVVRRRFTSSLKNFAEALPFCEQAFAIDNTIEFTLLARWSKGMISWWGNPRRSEAWLLRAIEDRIL